MTKVVQQILQSPESKKKSRDHNEKQVLPIK